MRKNDAQTTPRSGEPIWLFDLDNTLYPSSCRLFDQVDRRMGEFVQACLSIEDPKEARRIQKQYLREHGTTLRGLMEVNGIHPDAFLEYVHDIDLSPVAPAPALDRALEALPGRKLIYTNGSEAHAAGVLDRLGVARHFEAVFDIAAAGYLPKPARPAFEKCLERHAIAAERTVFFDDMPRNLEPAAAMGMTTVWVVTESEWARLGYTGQEDFIHHATEDLTHWLQQRL